MKLSIQLTLYISLAFAMLCLGYGAFGWHELGTMAAGPERDDAHGFALFWMFLGAIGLASAALSWWLVRREGR